MTDPILIFFAKFIEKEIAIVYSEFNLFQLQNRLEELVTFFGLKDVNTLYEQCVRDGISGHMKQMILDVATNNETSFFRDAKMFTYLDAEVMPGIKAKTEKLRIWCAACSTGQEPYTIAMMLNEAKGPLPKFEILASDISERVLKRARDGVYSQLEVQRGLPANLLVKYFEKNAADQWKFKSELKNAITFQKQNLTEPFSHLGKFHIIFCRNVLIYQSVEKKRETLSRIVERLEPGGILLLGAGESLIGLSDAFTPVNMQIAAVYQLRNPEAKAAA